MKVLWIVSPIFPYPASQIGIEKTVFGGWLNSLHQQLINYEEVELAIAATYKGKKYKRFDDGKTIYYLIPDKKPEKYNTSLFKFWKLINDDFKPNIVHIHGTEYPRGLSYINCTKNIPIIVSLQGLIHNCNQVWYGNIPYLKLLKNITIRDIFKPHTGLLSHKSAKKRGTYEKAIIKKADGVIGRTTYDYSITWSLDSKQNYYCNNEILRDTFYTNYWSYDTCKKRTIFFSQAQIPLKGFHIFLEALAILKNQYKDVIIRVAGNNIFDTSSFKKKLKIQSYTKYLLRIVEKYDLYGHIQFTGYLDENQMAMELKNCNVYVQSSSIENSSNSLCEAMILGVPCIASNVGGTSDLMNHKEDGFLYTYTEPAILANYINQLFNDKDLCIKYSKNARNKALLRHDRNNNVKEIINIYNKVKDRKY